MIYDLLWRDPLSLISYLLLLVSIISLWIKQDIKVWGTVATFALVCGILAQRISAPGVMSIVTLGLLYYTVNRVRIKLPIRIAAGVLAIILSVSLATHILPGFNNWKILNNIYLSKTSQPYSMYLNMDKTFVGLIILGLGFPLIKSVKEWASVIQATLPILLPGLIILVSISSIINYTDLDYKFPDLFIVWALNNLFFTCVAEEAFFRGFLQRNLSRKLRENRYGNILSLVTVSMLFGLAHFAGGFKYIIMASVAGMVYGYAYQKTQRIEAGILCHFTVNTSHFIFLTYPALVNT
jgi:CAAX protease family protein